MKTKSTKRGFTIVELVIVIAVIAILAAVLIPTFTGIVRKARESSDESAIRNMNTILAADGAVVPTDILDLYDVLFENGITAENYSPLYKNRYFFWDSVKNMVVYTDENYTVLYPENAKDSNKDNWISLSGKIAEVDVDDLTIDADGKVAVNTPEELVSVITAISEGDKDVKDVATIDLKANTVYNVMGAEFQINTLSKDIAINGNGATIKGVVNKEAVRDMDRKNNTNRAYYAGIVGEVKSGSHITISNLTIENAVIGDPSISQVALVGAVRGDASVTFDNVHIKNTTFIGLQKVGTFVAYVSSSAATVKIEANCTAENVTVEAVAGLNGGIFGAISEGATVQVAKAAMAKIDVDVKLNKIGAHYITMNDGTVYGIDMNDNMECTKEKIAIDGVDYLKYYRANAQYGFGIRAASSAPKGVALEVNGLDGIPAANRSSAKPFALPADGDYYVFTNNFFD